MMRFMNITDEEEIERLKNTIKDMYAHYGNLSRKHTHMHQSLMREYYDDESVRCKTRVKRDADSHFELAIRFGGKSSACQMIVRMIDECIYTDRELM